jgi:ATP-dependent DNA ligase
MADTCGDSVLVNAYGKGREHSPILNDIPPNSLLYGELYHGDGKMGALYDLLSNKLSDKLRLAIFDAKMIGGMDISMLPLIERREHIIKCFGYVNWAHCVETYWCEDAYDIESAFQEAVARGYEGVVVKQANSQLQFGASCTWVKLKYTATADLRICAIDPSQERIECELPNYYKPLGVKVMNKIKQTLHVGDIVEIEHYGVLAQGGLRHPVFKRVREPNKKVSVDI